jgi:RHS repeat-associated protein
MGTRPFTTSALPATTRNSRSCVFGGGILSASSALLWCLLAVLLLLCLFLPQQAMAQGDDFTTNFPPFGSFSVGDFDVISLQNGNVHFKIPLLSIPQRNGSVEFQFVYDTPIWNLSYTSTATKQFPRDGHYNVVPQQSTVALGLQDSGSWSVSRSAPVTVPCNGTSNFSHIIEFWEANDPEGGSHGFPLITLVPGNLNCPPPAINNSGLSIDGSGLLLTYIPSTDSTTLLLKDGTQINSQTLTSEDSNGNQRNLFSFSDDLGRPLVTVTNGPTVTLTSPSGKQKTNIQYTSYTVRDSNGNPQVYELDYELIDINTAFCPPFPPPPAHLTTCTEITGGSRVVPSRLLLPGSNPSLSYQFLWFNNSSNLQQITFPTGGSIAYTYFPPSCEGGPPGNRSCRLNVQTRTISAGGSSSTWTYTANTVTDPNGNDEVHIYGPVCVNSVCAATSSESEIQFWSGSSTNGSGTLLKKIHTDYLGEPNAPPASPVPVLGNIRPIRKTTTLDNGMVSKSETDYETFANAAGTIFTRLNPTEIREFDYGSGAPGPLLRKTDYTYLHNINSTYTALNIVDRPVSVTVYNGLGTQVSKTTYEYDVYSHAGLPGMGSSGAVQHDSARGTNYTTRGNITAVSRWLNTSGISLTTYNQYDDAGNVIASKDPNGNVISFDYTDSWANATCAPSGQARAYPKTVTNALGHVKQMTHNSCTGTLASLQDQNDINAGRSGTIPSYDVFGRVTYVSLPDGGQIMNCYTDLGGTGCSQSGPPYSVVTTKPIISGANPVTLTATKLTDGLGRVSQTQLNTDPDGITYTAVTYDLLGHVSQDYNPTRCNPPTTKCTQGPSPSNIPETTWGFSTTSYDALGRVKSVTAQDGSVTTSAYSGNCVTVTDTAGKSRKSCSDALGRLTDVWEDPSGVNYHTVYSYDALGNLLTVVQNGSRNRTFVYDSLSRLTSATNPESGTVSYTYDANGNLISKTSPAPNQTGTTTVTLSYCYDALNRLTSKAYTSQSCPIGSPVATYLYDQASYNGLTITNGIGRRTGMTDQAGTEAWSYDSMGRALFEKRTTNNVSKTISYTYNLDGSLYTAAIPTFADGSHSITPTYTPGGAGRPIALLSGSYNLLSNVKYTPAGQLCNSLGNWNGNWTTVKSFNNRLQPVFIYAIRQTAGSPPAPPPCAVSTPLPDNPNYENNALALSYSYPTGQNNGNISSITNLLFSPKSQSFTYDSLNRLASAQTTGTYATYPTYCWAESYTYDVWGNLLSDQPNPTTQSAYTGCTGEATFSTTANAKNQIALLSYDAAGNVTTSCGMYMAAPATCTYDAENHLTQFSWSGGSTTYTYDGDGKRVMKSGSPATIYWYGAGSDVLIETDLSNNIQAAYWYFNGQRAARQLPNNEVGFYFADHLGNTRYFQSLAGDEVSDFYPFGGERVYSGGNPTHYKFTGKERDSESGLDNFDVRYFGSSLGRFMSPDPLGPGQHPENPQSWNLYSYVLNNPLKLVDPSGQFTCDANTVSDQQCDNVQAALDKAQDAADKLGEKYGWDSKQYTDAQRAIDAYGDEGVDNGVTISQGNVGSDTAATLVSGSTVAKTAGNPNGQNIRVVFDRASNLLNGDINFLAALSAHEGVHVADGSDWVTSGFSANANPSLLQTERDAYRVENSIAEGFGATSINYSWGKRSYDFALPLTLKGLANVDVMIKREYPLYNLDAFSKNTKMRRF